MNHLNAVRLLHLYNGFSADALDSFAVSLTKRGLKRLLGTATRQKHPITPAILHQFRQHLSLELPPHAVVWALFCTAFFSFLRKSNLTVASFGSFKPSRHLALEPSFVLVGPRPCNIMKASPNSAPQHSGLRLVPRIGAAPLLLLSSSLLDSATFLPAYRIWSSSPHLLHLQHLPQASHLCHRHRSPAFFPAQLSSRWRHFRLPVWCTRILDKAPRGLALRCLSGLFDITSSHALTSRRHNGRRPIFKQYLNSASTLLS